MRSREEVLEQRERLQEIMSRMAPEDRKYPAKVLIRPVYELRHQLDELRTLILQGFGDELGRRIDHAHEAIAELDDVIFRCRTPEKTE
jgi:hypothetical protein